MENEIEISDWESCYNKVVDTIKSCTTIRQLIAARKYARNYFRTFTILAEETVDVDAESFNDFMNDMRGKLASLFAIQKAKIDNNKFN